MYNITQVYDLELAFLRARRKQEELQEAVKQSAWAYREAQQAEVEYLSSVRRLIHKITGNTDRLEEIRRKIQQAKAHHEYCTRELKSHEEIFEELERAMQEIPPMEYRKKIAKADPETNRYFAQREQELCAEMLRPILKQTLEALEDYRQHLRGGNSDRIMSVKEIQEICGAHIAPAKECHRLLLRLRQALEILEQPMEISAYFENPAGFVAAAARHNQLDKINAAISQVEASLKITQ